MREATIPVILEGRDVIGCAAFQTGTGKTAARYTLPLLNGLLLISGPNPDNTVQSVSRHRPHARGWRSRSLASSSRETTHYYAPISTTVVYGGRGRQGLGRTEARAC